MTRRRGYALALLVPLGLFACDAIIGARELTNEAPAAVDSGVDTGPPDAGADAAPSCTLAHAPAPPTMVADTGGHDFTVAISQIRAGISDPDHTDNFYDLDGVCTCGPGSAESCVRPSVMGASSPDTCDLSSGRDATGNRVVGIAAAIGVNDAKLSSQLAGGKFGAVVSVRGYNGKADDPVVQVDFAPSYGCLSAGSIVAPKFDGTDTWSYDNRAATDDGTLITSKYEDKGAYVSGGVLVAHLPIVVIVLQFDFGNSNPLPIRISEAVVTANVVASDAGSFSLSGGRATGRVAAHDIFKSFTAWQDPYLMGFRGICPPDAGTSQLFPTVEQKVCGDLDLRASGVDDQKGKPCDALSFGLGFDAVPTGLAGAYGYPYKATECFDPATFDQNAPGTFECP